MGETEAPCPSPHTGDAVAALNECADASISLAEWSLLFALLSLCGTLMTCTLLAWWTARLHRHT